MPFQWTLDYPDVKSHRRGEVLTVVGRGSISLPPRAMLEIVLRIGDLPGNDITSSVSVWYPTQRVWTWGHIYFAAFHAYPFESLTTTSNC